MQPGFNQAHSTFRNQPPYTIFNKSFEDSSDVLFLQLNEIDPYFLSDEQLQDNNGFSQGELIDPRTKKKLQYATYDHTDRGKYCRLFKGAGLKSTLTKKQQDICLRVLLGWQERKEIDETDLIVWRQMQGKIIKERKQMQKFISDYAEAHKEDIYAPTKRLDEYYRQWFKRKTNMLLKRHPENMTFNTHTGLPHVSVCKSSNDEKAEICGVQLLERNGWLRLHVEEEQIEWKKLNFNLKEYAEKFNDTMDVMEEEKSIVKRQLDDFDDRENGRNCYLPFETILFLFTAGNYVDLPTECLLEISDASDNDKIIKFDRPFPARNCGWHTHQQVVEQSYAAFLSVKGRSKWLHVENKKVEAEILETAEIHAVLEDDGVYKPQTFERYLDNTQTVSTSKEENVKCNSALIKWYLQAPESVDSLKILTTLSLPPTLDQHAEQFQAHETLKLEYKSQFGCELMTKYDLLRAWLKMRLMNFAKTTNYAYCYRLSSIDCDLQLKEHLTLEVVEHQLKNTYHVNPVQLIDNLAEFLKLLFNMPSGKYMLRYNAKYKDKFLLCAPSREITLNTVYLHGLLQADPTDMLFMTQAQYLPILETLCSHVHLKHRILPCAFLPQLPHQRNLQTAVSRAKAKNSVLQKKQAAERLAAKSEKSQAENLAAKKRKQKRWMQHKKKRAADKREREQEAETKRLLEFK